jgi:hypothetical protein
MSDGRPFRSRAGHKNEFRKELKGRIVIDAARVGSMMLDGKILVCESAYALPRDLGTFSFGDTLQPLSLSPIVMPKWPAHSGKLYAQ